MKMSGTVIQETMDLPNGDIHHQLMTRWHTYFHPRPLMTTHRSTTIASTDKGHGLCYNELFLKINVFHINLYTHSL